MGKITSRDGASIAYQRSGTGPPLVLVHGTLGSSRRWPILSLLEKRFTVYAIDRRGRGESGDGADYAIVREFEDIVAVVDMIGDEVNLYGHSFGGLCVLEAALLTSRVRRLIVYEPPPVPVPAGFVDRIQGLLDAGDREGVVMSLLSEVVEMPTDELEMLKASPVFPAMVAAAHTVPREQHAEEEYRLEPERFKDLAVPTLFLLGGDSPAFSRASVESWHAALPNSRIVVLPGQQHIAHYTAPDLLVHEVETFLAEPG